MLFTSKLRKNQAFCAKYGLFSNKNFEILINRFNFAVLYNNIIYQINKIMSDIESKVKAIIVDKLGVDEAEVKNEASFANDLGADSLDTVELIMEFEKEFQIQIPDDQAEKISTVGDAVAYIEANVK